MRMPNASCMHGMLSGVSPAGKFSVLRSTLSTTCSGRLMRENTVRIGVGIGILLVLLYFSQCAGWRHCSRIARISSWVGCSAVFT
jgi:hypothetical protein